MSQVDSGEGLLAMCGSPKSTWPDCDSLEASCIVVATVVFRQCLCDAQDFDLSHYEHAAKTWRGKGLGDQWRKASFRRPTPIIEDCGGLLSWNENENLRRPSLWGSSAYCWPKDGKQDAKLLQKSEPEQLWYHDDSTQSRNDVSISGAPFGH